MVARIDKLPQPELVLALREAVDAAMIADPLRGPSPAARKRLLRLIRENPTSVRSPHVVHNIGARRAEWLRPILERAS
jgi:hypothetical protein